MATLPRHPPSWSQQRRASPPAPAPAEQGSSEQSQATRTNSFSAASIDSQTVLLNSPTAEFVEPVEATQQQQDQSTQAEPQPTEDNEPRRCWICFNDETEDDETTSEWRSPCPCVLVAHEKCLLDWVADMEAPNSRRRAGRNAGKILCPQCKAEIRLQRPRSVVVESVRAMERLAKTFVLPGALTIVGVATAQMLRMLGQDSIIKVFGTEDAMRIMRPSYFIPQGSSNVSLDLLRYLRDNWQLNIGLPAIPIVLVLSRTRIADSFLPFLPLVFFANSGSLPQDTLLQFSWPPSAAFTISALPYVRSIYNSYYDRVWLRHERRWLKEVQPRAEAEPEEVNGEEAVNADDAEAILNAIVEEEGGDDDGDDVVELEVDVDLLFDWHAGGPADNNNAPENPPVPIARGPGRPADVPPANEAPAAAEANDHNDFAPAPEVPREPAQPRRARVRRERNATISTAGIADTVLGALLFPSVAAVMGEALKLVLPASWVTAPAIGKPTGFLQAKWARSIVGGCLFVGLKDAVLLYVRWRVAQAHRQRRVLDYAGSKGKKKNKT